MISSNTVNAINTRYIDPIFSQITTNNITYSPNLQLDLYQPQNDTLTTRPAIIWIHGGGFFSGDKEDMSSMAQEFAKKGYVTASINYRLVNPNQISSIPVPSQISSTPAIINAQTDAQAAVRWLRANATNFKINPDKIFVAGSSAGAITALLVAYNRSPSDELAKVAGVVSMSGTADPVMVDAGEPPVIMFNGNQDTLILPIYAQTFQTKIESVGIPHQFYWYPDAGHGNIPSDELINKTTQFLANLVDNNKTGDYNHDGLVNLTDFDFWKTKYLQNLMSLTDFDIWKTAYLLQ